MSSGTSGTTSGLSGSSEGTDTSSITAVSFVLTPAQAVMGLINYSTSEGQKLYKSATAALMEEGFGLDVADLKVFWKPYQIGPLSTTSRVSWTSQKMPVIPLQLSTT